MKCWFFIFVRTMEIKNICEWFLVCLIKNENALLCDFEFTSEMLTLRKFWGFLQTGFAKILRQKYRRKLEFARGNFSKSELILNPNSDRVQNVFCLFSQKLYSQVRTNHEKKKFQNLFSKNTGLPVNSFFLWFAKNCKWITVDSRHWNKRTYRIFMVSIIKRLRYALSPLFNLFLVSMFHFHFDSFFTFCLIKSFFRFLGTHFINAFESQSLRSPMANQIPSHSNLLPNTTALWLG